MAANKTELEERRAEEPDLDDEDEEILNQIWREKAAQRATANALSKTDNAFCPTGPGGGIKNDCPPHSQGEGGSWASSKEGGASPPPQPDRLPPGKGIEKALKGWLTKRTGPKGNTIVKVGGKEYMVKKGRYSRSEILASRMASLAEADVAVTDEVEIGGERTLVTEMVDGAKSLEDIGDQFARKRALEKLPKSEVERQTLYDYIIGAGDVHDGNYLIKGERLIGIDKDLSLMSGAQDRTRFAMADYLHNLGGHSYTLSRREVEHMIKASEKVAKGLEKQGANEEAVGVRKRGKVLSQLLRLYGDSPTVGQLHNLGSLPDEMREKLGGVSNTRKGK